MVGVKNTHPEKDILSLARKVIFVTGGSFFHSSLLTLLTTSKGTAGLGQASIKELAKHNPSHIYFSGRYAKAGHAFIEAIKGTIPDANLTFIDLDLSSLSSIKAAIP